MPYTQNTEKSGSIEMSRYIYQRTGRHIPNTASLNTHFRAVKNSKFTHESNPGFPKLFFKIHLCSHQRLYLPRETVQNSASIPYVKEVHIMHSPTSGP